MTIPPTINAATPAPSATSHPVGFEVSPGSSGPPGVSLGLGLDIDVSVADSMGEGDRLGSGSAVGVSS
ncbi:MAG: hypothetical protein KIT69_20615, partial [Propionibacteriaceae bacterium]|nr:hypothetical protein [Propionibacteriaceae bacterium]